MLPRLSKHLTYANVVSTLCLFLVLTGGIAYGASKVVYGNDIATGTITARNIKTNSLPANKLTPSARTALKGATGPQGPTGPAGINTVQEEFGVFASVPAGATGTATVHCPPGRRAFGGGTDSGTLGGELILHSSTPTVLASGWEVRVTNGGTISANVRAIALCAPALWS